MKEGGVAILGLPRCKAAHPTGTEEESPAGTRYGSPVASEPPCDLGPENSGLRMVPL